jgi:hypothetical protein
MLAPQILRLQHRSFPLVLLPLPQRLVPLVLRPERERDDAGARHSALVRRRACVIVLRPLLLDQMQLLRLLMMMRQRLPLGTAHPHSRQHQQPALRL